MNDRLFEQAENKYLEGAELLPDEHACMLRALDSADPRKASIACGALLRDAGAPAELKRAARETLRRLCAQLVDDRETGELSITILLIPQEELQCEVVQLFVFRLMISTAFTRRSNGVALLERLGQMGISKAIEQLQRCSKEDAHEIVRNAAVAALHRIERSER